MSFISALSLRVPVWSITFLGLDLPLTILVDNAGKRKQFLICTQKITSVKLEQLRSARLIQGDQKITTRYAKALNKTKEFISLLASRLSIIKHGN
jgi:hypothetical protein